MTQRTSFLARLIGLYCVLYSLTMFIRGRALADAIIALVQDQTTMLILGLVLVAAGLAMVLAHNVWSGGALTVIVTVIGWLSTLKGMVLLLVPPAWETELFMNWLRYRQLFDLYAIVTLVLGAWLTYRGFASRARS